MKKFFLLIAIVAVLVAVKMLWGKETPQNSICTYQIENVKINIDQEAYELLQKYPSKKDFHIKEAFDKGISKIAEESIDSTRKKVIFLKYQNIDQTMYIETIDTLKEKFNQQSMLAKWILIGIAFLAVAIIFLRRRKKIQAD